MSFIKWTTIQVWAIIYRSHYNCFSIVMAWHKTGAEQEVFPTGPTDTMLASAQVVAWNQAGDKPIPEQMMTQSIDAHMDNKVSMRMSWIARWHGIGSLYHLIFHTPYTLKLIHSSHSFCVWSRRPPHKYKLWAFSRCVQDCQWEQDNAFNPTMLSVTIQLFASS